MKKYLYIVDPKSNTILDLDRQLFLVDSAGIPDSVDAIDVTEYIINNADKIGYRLDNYNMANLFFGGNE